MVTDLLTFPNIVAAIFHSADIDRWVTEEGQQNITVEQPADVDNKLLVYRNKGGKTFEISVKEVTA